MGRKTKNSHTPQMPREPRNASVQVSREPTEQRVPNLDLPIAWNFNRMDSGGKFQCNLKRLHDFTDALIRLEGKTVGQLMGRAHNHPMAADKLSREARERINALNIEEETLHQLDLKTPARLWGVFEHNIFHIIWLDAKHEVYQSR